MYHCFAPEWLLIPLIFTTSPLPVLLLPLNCCHITYPCISATSQLLPLLTASHLNDYYLMANVLQLPSLTYMYDHLIASALLLPTSHANITSSCLTTTSHLPYLTIATSKLPVLLLPHTYHTIATTSQLHVLLLTLSYCYLTPATALSFLSYSHTILIPTSQLLSYCYLTTAPTSPRRMPLWQPHMRMQHVLSLAQFWCGMQHFLPHFQ